MPLFSSKAVPNKGSPHSGLRFFLLSVSVLFIFQLISLPPSSLFPQPKAIKKAYFTQVPILMYHQIGDRAGRFRVTPENFRRTLWQLYLAGYSTISLEEYVTGDMSGLPPGRRPVIITFDDGSRGQINYIPPKEEGGVPKLHPYCALAMLLSFQALKPEFRAKATFFIFLADLPFGQPEYAADKLNLILSLGMEIGNHTYNHKNCQALSNPRIARDLIRYQRRLRQLVGPRADRVKFIAWPLGAVPGRHRLLDLLPKVTFENESYSYMAAFHAWKGPAPYPMPENKRWRLPRIEAHNRLPQYLLEPEPEPEVLVGKTE